jgi:hypothetical protein
VLACRSGCSAWKGGFCQLPSGFSAQPATPPDELADMIDDDLNDEVNI